MRLERTKDVMLMNPKGRKRRKKRGGSKSKRRRTSVRRRRHSAPKRSAARRHRHAAPKRRRGRARRRRNPGMDIAGTAIAQAAGALGALIAQPVAHLANSKLLETNKDGKNHPRLAMAARVLAPSALGFGAGLVAGKFHPAIGKGIAAGAGATAMLQGMSALTNAMEKPPEFLRKAGFAQLGAADDYFVRDGHVYKALPDGSEQMMFGAAALPIDLETPGGGVVQVTGVGQLNEGALVMRDGRFQLLPGVRIDGLQQATDLAGLQQATDLAGLQQATDLGRDEDDYGM